MTQRQSLHETSASRTPALGLVAAALFIFFAPGCGQETGGDKSKPEENPEAAVWRVEIRSDDPTVRARAVDLVAGAPGDDGLATLEELAVRDPDPRVREQAVLAYAQLAGKDGAPLLKDVALGDESEAVVSAALATLERFREETPPRAWMDVDFPNTFPPGEELSVRVRFGSAESAPKAMLQLRMPEGFTPVGAERFFWRGEVVEGAQQEVVFKALAPTRPVQSGARVRLQVDYPEQLDFDLLHKQVRVAVENGSGRFENQPPAKQRSF